MTRLLSSQSICRFAAAVGDITPPEGIYHRMWGAATHDQAAGVHRPLRASVLIFAAADSSADDLSDALKAEQSLQILVALDHCLLGRDEISDMLDAIARETGLPTQAVSIVFSHTHAAGLMTLDRQSLPGGDLIPSYLKQVNERVCQLANEAKGNLQSATIMYGYGHCDLAGHRDLWDEDSDQWVCGFNPDEEADDTVLALRVLGQDGKLLATVVNYACHPTTLAWDNQLVSPDYPGAMRETIEQAEAAPCIFIQGASGDLGPREGYVGDVEVADRNGRQLGYAALSTLSALGPPQTDYEYAGPVVSGATIGVWKHQPLQEARQLETARWEVRRFEVSLAYRAGMESLEETKADLAKWQADEEAAREAGDSQKAADCRAMAERKTRVIARLSALPVGDSYPFQVALWRIGDAIWVAVQGEPYNLLQRTLRQRFPDRPIILAAIAGGWGPTYLPTADIYDKGIYQESIAVLASGALEQLSQAIADQIEDLLSAS